MAEIEFLDISKIFANSFVRYICTLLREIFTGDLHIFSDVWIHCLDSIESFYEARDSLRRLSFVLSDIDISPRIVIVESSIEGGESIGIVIRRSVFEEFCARCIRMFCGDILYSFSYK